MPLGNAVSKGMIIVAKYTHICKGDVVVITGLEETACPICGGKLTVRGTCQRKVRSESHVQTYRLRVMKCSRCGRTHREIPDNIIPYKRTGLNAFCDIAEAEEDTYTCDTSTWQRVRRWLAWFLAFARSVEQGLVCSGLLKMTRVAGEPLRRQTAYFVRLVVNSGNWIHNRSAVHVGTTCHIL